jgi:hypothetical protein
VTHFDRLGNLDFSLRLNHSHVGELARRGGDTSGFSVVHTCCFGDF